MQLADLLQNRKERDHDVRGAKGVRAFHAWLRSQVAANRPWNELAREVLTATGDTVATPQIGYYIVTVGEKHRASESEVVASVAQAFLGTRITCAQCHNHPLERYTQDDYYHFAAFFSRLALDRRNPQEGPTELMVAGPEEAQLLRRLKQIEKRLAELETQTPPTDPQAAEKAAQELESQRNQKADVERQLEQRRGEPAVVRQPRTGAMLAPQPLDRSRVTVCSDPRQTLADWITHPDNEYFSGAIVNRLWRRFLGVGLVEPVDDLRASNPPSNQELWNTLNREFVRSGFDLKHMMRLILNSRTYQLSSETLPENAQDNRYYSHYNARRLPAEVLLDAVCQATGVPDEFPGYPRGVRAIQIPDPSVNSYFLSLFGRSERVTACACERNGDVTLPQLLHMQNGDWIDIKLKSAESRVSTLAQNISDDNQLIEEAFLSTLSRLPTPTEREAVTRVFAAAPDRQTALFDTYWTLMNTKEFAFNH